MDSIEDLTAVNVLGDTIINAIKTIRKKQEVTGWNFDLRVFE